MGLKMGAGSSTAGAGGTLSDIHHRIQCVRFIPAGAGNTFFCTLITPSTTVYPRWRREHHLSDVAENTIAGLSPLAQGTRATLKRQRVATRFIPAGAGNTSIFPDLWTLQTVYPRWRREHVTKLAHFRRYRGLSPLAQGTLRSRGCLIGKYRFIPAGAGNTQHQLE